MPDARQVAVDQLACEGHARCRETAAAVFRLNDDDISQVILDPVPPEEIERVDEAIRLCPRQAINWVE